MRRLQQDRKGFFGDLPIWIIGIFAFAIAAIVASVLMTNINSAVQADDSLAGKVKSDVGQQTSRFPAMVDGMLMFLFGVGSIFLIISAFLVGDNPLLFTIAFIFVVLLVIVGAGLANVWGDLVEDPDVAGASVNLVFLPFLLEKFPYVVVFLGFMLFLGLFVKSRSG